MPKPCPEKPLARKKPGTLSTGPITGTASGVTSMRPDQLCWMRAPAKAGNALMTLSRPFWLKRSTGTGSSTRTRSNGEISSSLHCRGVRHSSRKRLPIRSFSSCHCLISEGTKSANSRKLSGTIGTTLALRMAIE